MFGALIGMVGSILINARAIIVKNIAPSIVLSTMLSLYALVMLQQL